MPEGDRRLLHALVGANCPGNTEDSIIREDGVKNKPRRYSAAARGGAIRMVLEHERDYDSQWAAVRSIAEKPGCTAETPMRMFDDRLSLAKKKLQAA